MEPSVRDRRTRSGKHEEDVEVSFPSSPWPPGLPTLLESSFDAPSILPISASRLVISLVCQDCLEAATTRPRCFVLHDGQRPQESPNPPPATRTSDDWPGCGTGGSCTERNHHSAAPAPPRPLALSPQGSSSQAPGAETTSAFQRECCRLGSVVSFVGRVWQPTLDFARIIFERSEHQRRQDRGGLFIPAHTCLVRMIR